MNPTDTQPAPDPPMPSRVQENAVVAALRVTRQLAHATARSPLLKYVMYALIIHAVFVGATSYGTWQRLVVGVNQPAAGEKTTPAKDQAKPGAETPAKSAGGDAAKPEKPVAAKTPGKPGDYSKTDLGKEEQKATQSGPKSVEDMMKKGDPFGGM